MGRITGHKMVQSYGYRNNLYVMCHKFIINFLFVPFSFVSCIGTLDSRMTLTYFRTTYISSLMLLYRGNYFNERKVKQNAMTRN